MAVINGSDPSVAPTSAALTSAAASWFTWFSACTGSLAGGVSLAWQPEAAFVNAATGQLQAQLSYTVPGTLTVSGTSAYAAPAGIIVKWLTGVVVNGHSLKGKTFLVPANAGVFQADGTVLEATRATLQTAINTFVSASTGSSTYHFAVWHRPINGAGGSVSPITAGAVNDKVAVLTSRRD